MLKLMSYNIRFGGVGRERRLAEVIRQCGPDIVVLQEATREEGVRLIAKLAQMPYWAAKQGHSTAFISRVGVEHEAHVENRLHQPSPKRAETSAFVAVLSQSSCKVMSER